MASLTEVYRGGGGGGLQRLYAGVALFGVGAILVTTGLLVVSTELGATLGLGQFEARELAGVLGGIGFPAVLLGTMVALPRASRRLQAAAAVGALFSLVGVGLFVRFYPVDWVGGSGDTTMTLVVSVSYFVGTIVTSWCLFTAVANFKARNDPGGTISLEITKEGETRVVEVSNDELRGRLGGIGMLGATPDGEVETQTNRPDGGTRTRSGGASVDPTDGGTDHEPTIREPGFSDDAEFLDDGPSTPISDTYCGNCAYFRYVRTDDGLVPYCGLHSEAMDDMDACDEWSPNTS
ncbi:DUF7139 domain-containing protein [Natronomonas salsuginis]|jgi:hypothetical protein|uniref:Ribonuclease BN n=1 Tax=Natronomonas salsuginis TaxID=2217661 RepID=A0A4U5JA46_9EURY|nr:ribonuclease BN [Natronomonas salsuginis]TKR24377.1 ribonuclease BN [Natronomonas salsuginis]